MPLKALYNGAPVYADEVVSEDEWNEFRRRSRAGELLMPCCQTAAVAKKLQLYGTRFFSHKHMPGTCDSASKGESPEHDRLKGVARRAAKKMNADAESEVRGDGWIADVMVTFRDVRRVIEIQLSKQNYFDTVERTNRYRRSGISDVLWIMREVPPELIGSDEITAVPLPRDQSQWVWLVEKVTKLFTIGRLVWNPDSMPDIPITLIEYDVLCHRCGVVWTFTPWAILRYSEVRGDRTNHVRAASWFPPGTFPAGLPRLSCPTCGTAHQPARIKMREALQYPGRKIHGYWSENSTPYWGQRPPPPEPCMAPDEAAWKEIVFRHGLIVRDEEIIACKKRIERERRAALEAAEEAARNAAREAAERARLEAEKAAERLRLEAEERNRRRLEDEQRARLAKIAYDRECQEKIIRRQREEQEIREEKERQAQLKALRDAVRLIEEQQSRLANEMKNIANIIGDGFPGVYASIKWMRDVIDEVHFSFETDTKLENYFVAMFGAQPYGGRGAIISVRPDGPGLEKLRKVAGFVQRSRDKTTIRKFPSRSLPRHEKMRRFS